MTLKNSTLDLDIFYKKEALPNLSVGDKVNLAIYLELPKPAEGDGKKVKERVQNYQGVIISKHLNSKKIDATITVRKMFQGGASEKVFLLNSPWLKEITVLTNSSVRRAKLYYLRERTGKSARLKIKR
jgi:large subunit ribosomal protein L19|tara:strand:+ start:23111 stop:23494 length:384 start_codon:yes stop_codon:yes gene_type:complete